MSRVKVCIEEKIYLIDAGWDIGLKLVNSITDAHFDHPRRRWNLPFSLADMSTAIAPYKFISEEQGRRKDQELIKECSEEMLELAQEYLEKARKISINARSDRFEEYLGKSAKLIRAVELAVGTGKLTQFDAQIFSGALRIFQESE